MKTSITITLILLLALTSCKNSKKDNPQSQKQEKIELESNVAMNIIHCENEKFTIKVDRLKNEDIRYTSWNKPKSITAEPDLVILNGTIEKLGTAGGYHFIFENGEWTYTIENNLMGETMESMGIFLNLMHNGEEKRYTKMTDLKE